MKRKLLSISFVIGVFFSVVAKQLPTDVLDANIGLVYYEFNGDANAGISLKEARTLLEEKGYNIVSVHNVTNVIDAEIAVADLDYKKVKYIIKIVAKPPLYTMFLIEKNEKLDRTFKTDNQLIIEQAGSIANVVKKLDNRFNSYRKKELLTNSVEYDKTLADTILISEDSKKELALNNEKRSLVKYVFGDVKEEIPSDIKTAKIAFVNLGELEKSIYKNAINKDFASGLKKSNLNYEIFNTYEEYLKRKSEFKYRIIVAEKVIYSGNGGNINFKTSWNMNNSSWQTKPDFFSGGDGDSFFTIFIKDEKNSQIYECSSLKHLVSKAFSEFIDKVESN